MATAGQPPEGKNTLAEKSIDELARHSEHQRCLCRRDLMGGPKDDHRSSLGDVLEHLPQRVTQIRSIVDSTGELTRCCSLRPALGNEGGQC